MRIAILSDVHGNAPALEACLARLRPMAPDALYFLGDAVGYLPGEADVLDRLADEHALCQQGNHEAMMLHPTPESLQKESQYRLADARERLAPAALDRIAQWPDRREVPLGQRRLLLVHGSPQRPLDGYVYADDDLSPFDDLTCDAVFMGNTHRPFVREHRGKLLVNVGSVGLPRDQGNLAAFALYDDRDHACRVFRVRFDVADVLAACADAVSPDVRQCLRREATQPIFGEFIE